MSDGEAWAVLVGLGACIAIEWGQRREVVRKAAAWVFLWAVLLGMVGTLVVLALRRLLGGAS